MGISLWLVWKSEHPKNQKLKAQIIFAIQLFLNFWWSFLFFKFQSPSLAFIEIIVLLIFIIITIFSFSKISKPAAWLLVPYAAWVSFAAILNYTIMVLN
jgi:translocator protein